MTLEASRRFGMMEDAFEWSVFECCTVYVSCDPVVIEHWCTLWPDRAGLVSLGCRAIETKSKLRTHNFIMEHVVRSTRQTRVMSPTLPDELQHVVYTGQHVVHEHNCIEELSFQVPELMQRDEGCVAHFGKILDAVIECAPGAMRGTNDYPHAN